MILLGRNAKEIEGVAIFPDHENEKQFWYLSGKVRLSERGRKPVFTLLTYQKRENEGAGYVMFEVNIGLPDAVKRRILSQLPPGSNLAPVTFNQGIVKAQVLDKRVGDSPPTLYGDNTAIFGLALDGVQTPLIEQAFEGGGASIGVIYDLEFTAMNPSLDVKIEADLSRVYKEFKATLGFKGVIPVAPPFMLDASIEAGFQKLVNNQAIVIDVVTYVDDEDNKRQRDAALSLFMDKLLKEWFEPTLTQPQVTEKEDQAGSTNVSNNGAQGGQPGEETGEGAGIADTIEDFLPQAKVKLRSINQIKFEKFEYHYRGSQTTTKKYYPQGLFKQLLAEGKVQRKEGIIDVDIDKPFFRTIEIDVQAPQISYEKYGLQSIHFAAKYPNREIESRILTKTISKLNPLNLR